MKIYASILIIINMFLMPNASQAQKIDAIVKISTTCTGVCVTSTGIIISAKHCGNPKEITVRFSKGKTVKAKLLFTPKEWDGCIVYQCENGKYPFLTVSNRRPLAGDKVHTISYPGIDSENLITMKGLLTGAKYVFTDRSMGKRIAANEVDFQSMGGMSGGPLFNDKNEVMGLLSTTDGMHGTSQFIQLSAIRSSLSVATGVVSSKKRILYAFAPDY